MNKGISPIAPGYDVMPDVSWSTSDLSDQFSGDQDRELQIVQKSMTSFGGRSWYFGQALIVESTVPNEPLSLIPFLQAPGHGRIIVAATPREAGYALFGDRMAGLAVQNGWAGVILDGFVRDVADLARMPMGVHALGARPNRAPTFYPPVEAKCLTIGGATFRSGHWIYVDSDGIIAMSSRHTDPS